MDCVEVMGYHVLLVLILPIIVFHNTGGVAAARYYRGTVWIVLSLRPQKNLVFCGVFIV